MDAHDIIVIGASAGGVNAVTQLVSALEPDLAAAVFVTIHVPAWTRSELAAVVSAHGHLQAVQATDNAPIRHGRIYCAPADYHLLVERDRVKLWKGPKENRHRPAINAMFRSAAASHGPRVIGIILSGVLDDGTAGLWWVKRFGGIAMVQDPAEAQFPEMPCSALEHVEVDYTLPLMAMPPLLEELTGGSGWQDRLEPTKEQLR